MKNASVEAQVRTSRFRRLAVLVALVVGALVCLLFVARFIAVDRCLDSGGRWNYEAVECER